MSVESKPFERKTCPKCGRKTLFSRDCGAKWICSYCHYEEDKINSYMVEMSKTARVGDWKGYNEARDKLNKLIEKCLEPYQKKFEREGIYPSGKDENPCFEKSFEAVDEANHPIRAAVVVDEGMRKFSVCHSRDGKDHMCYISGDNPEDQYKYVRKMFESWGYKVKEVLGESCL